MGPILLLFIVFILGVLLVLFIHFSIEYQKVKKENELLNIKEAILAKIFQSNQQQNREEFIILKYLDILRESFFKNDASFLSQLLQFSMDGERYSFEIEESDKEILIDYLSNSFYIYKKLNKDQQ